MSDLEQTFAKAAAIAKKVPQNLQEAAFNRALDALLGAQGKAKGASGNSRGRSQRRGPGKEELGSSGLLGEIDRTKYPDVGATGRVADQALKILQLAREDHNVDGLTAAEITEILTQKFRLPTKVAAVRMALERESDNVDVRSGSGGRHIFRIMAPGDAYLSRLRSGQMSANALKPRAGKSKPATKNKLRSKKESHTKEAKSTASPKAMSKSSGRPGPKAAITKLVDSGFFTSPRTISEIQENLKHKRGNAYSVMELAPALVRCVRDDSLTRERNDAGQYEYSQA